MTKVIHPVAGLFATLTIATFWLSTALSELFALHTVVTAKTTIPLGFLLRFQRWQPRAVGLCKGPAGRAGRYENQAHANYCRQRLKLGKSTKTEVLRYRRLPVVCYFLQ